MITETRVNHPDILNTLNVYVVVSVTHVLCIVTLHALYTLLSYNEYY